MPEKDFGQIVEMFRDNSEPADDDLPGINGDYNQVAGHDVINIYTPGLDENSLIYIILLMMIWTLLVLTL